MHTNVHTGPLLLLCPCLWGARWHRTNAPEGKLCADPSCSHPYFLTHWSHMEAEWRGGGVGKAGVINDTHQTLAQAKRWLNSRDATISRHALTDSEAGRNLNSPSKSLVSLLRGLKDSGPGSNIHFVCHPCPAIPGDAISSPPAWRTLTCPQTSAAAHRQNRGISVHKPSEGVVVVVGEWLRDWDRHRDKGDVELRNGCGWNYKSRGIVAVCGRINQNTTMTFDIFLQAGNLLISKKINSELNPGTFRRSKPKQFGQKTFIIIYLC